MSATTTMLIPLTAERIEALQVRHGEHAPIDGTGGCAYPGCREPAPCWHHRDSAALLHGAGITPRDER